MSDGLKDSTKIGVSCTGALVESAWSEPRKTDFGVRVFQTFRRVPLLAEPDDALTLAEALLHLRRFVTCSAPEAGAVFGELVRQGLAISEGAGYRITASGDRLGKAVLRHIQACTGTLERARPDGCFERLCCPRCGGDINLLQREEH